MVDIKTRADYQTAMRSRVVYHFMKRVFDIVVSLIIILVTLPVFLVVCYLINKQKGRPIFHSRKCAGKSGVPFTMSTFRTKSIRSKVITAFPPHPFPESWQNGVPNEFSFHYSPQTTYTTLGLTLEKYRLHKLPLLFHVLTGKLSLVGPEPELIEIATHYNKHQLERLQVKPGLMGYAKVKDESPDFYDQQIRDDLYYIRNRSLLFDVKIIISAISNLFLK